MLALLPTCRGKVLQFEELVREKDNAVKLAVEEIARLNTRGLETQKRLSALEAENKMLLERWMGLKMEEAEKVNEVKYKDSDATAGYEIGHPILVITGKRNLSRHGRKLKNERASGASSKTTRRPSKDLRF